MGHCGGEEEQTRNSEEENSKSTSNGERGKMGKGKSICLKLV